MPDVFLPLTRKLNRGPIGNHDATQLRPTKLPPNSIPPEGQSFQGPIDVRQPLCPQSTPSLPVPDRIARPNDDVVDTVLISPGRQVIVFQEHQFDLYPMLALNAILRDKCSRMDFNNLFRSPQKLAFLPNWDSVPRIEAIKDPPKSRPAYGHIQVPNELPQRETKVIQDKLRCDSLRIDTGPAKPFAKIAKGFEEFRRDGSPGAPTEVTLESDGGGLCENLP